MSDRDAAESHLAWRFTIYEENLPQDHPDRLDGQFGLARVYHRQGRYTEAETLYHATLEGRRRVLGDGYSHTVNSMNNLALVYYLELGRLADAEPLLVEAHERLTRAIEGSALLFERDLEVVLHSLVDLFERLDRPSEAAYYRKLLTERESGAADRTAT